MNAVLEAKEINSMADVEIGQIVYSSWGYDQTNIDFYKVIRKTAAMVELQAIGQKYLESTSSMSEYVIADPENELYERHWVISGDSYSEQKVVKEKGWVVAKDQFDNKGQKPFVWNSDYSQQIEVQDAVKYERPLISKHKAEFSNGRLAVKFASYKYGWSWDGQRLHQSHWA